jgi:hypothetical protein
VPQGTASGIATEIRNEVIADEVREHGATAWKKLIDVIKPGGEKAYNAITLSWFGIIGDKAERAFATIVALWTDYYVNHNFLAPHHAQKRMNETLEFLKSQGPKNFARYRAKLAKDPDEERRVMTFGELVNTENNDERQQRFDMVVPPKDTSGETTWKGVKDFFTNKAWPLLIKVHKIGEKLRATIDTKDNVDRSDTKVKNSKSLRKHPSRSIAKWVTIVALVYILVLILIVVPLGIYLIGG